MIFATLFSAALAINAVAFASSGKWIHLAFCAVALTGVWASLEMREWRGSR